MQTLDDLRTVRMPHATNWNPKKCFLVINKKIDIVCSPGSKLFFSVL